MSTINSVTLSGNLSTKVYDDPQKASVRFQVAYNESWYDRELQRQEERTYYIWVQVNGHQAQTVLNLTKGSGVVISGKIKGGSYLDQHNNWQNNAQIQAETVKFVSSSAQQKTQTQDNQTSKPSKPNPAKATPSEIAQLAEIPF